MRSNLSTNLVEKQTKTTWELLYEYVLLMWDGLEFFGLDETKLDRLKGHKVTFFTKFKSIRWIIMNFILAVLVIILFNQEISKLGMQKSQTVDLIDQDTMFYDPQESLPVFMFNFLEIKPVTGRIREWQANNTNNTSIRQHTRLIPLEFDDWDYYDKRYFEEFICNHSHAKYRETRHMDVSMFPNWVEMKDIYFECSILENFVSNWIRINHRLPYPFTDTPLNSSYFTSDYERAKRGGGILSIPDEELKLAKFSRSNAFNNQLLLWLDPVVLYGLKT